jgi:hypothetical protein
MFVDNHHVYKIVKLQAKEVMNQHSAELERQRKHYAEQEQKRVDSHELLLSENKRLKELLQKHNVRF